MIDGRNNQLLAQFFNILGIIYTCSDLICVLLNNFDESITCFTINEKGTSGNGTRFGITVQKRMWRMNRAPPHSQRGYPRKNDGS